MSSGKLLASAVIAALGGLLFGFDCIVISGAEQKFQLLWDLNDSLHGWAMSSALWGTVVGAILGNLPTDRFGRKQTLLWIGGLYFVSAIWSGLATDVYTFMIARFLGGLGVGVSTVAAPLYISEIAPPAKRGLLAGMFQFNIVLGILLAYLSNSLLEGTSDNDWRWMFAVEGFPALLYTLAAFTIPESPRWLICLRGDRQQAEKVLAQITPSASAAEISAAADEIAAAAVSEEKATTGSDLFRRLRVPILLAFLVAFFNQLSGINAILYFAPRILGMAGLEDPRMGQVGIGVVNLVFTMLGLWMIDRAGRRSLLLIGSVGYIVSLGLVAFTFFAYEAPLRVAGDALAVQAAESRLAQAETDGLTGETLASIQKKATEAVESYNQSIDNPAYTGSPLAIATGSEHEQVIATAKQAAAEASELAGKSGTIVLLGIFLFIAAHAVGQGAVIWVLISEVFPNEHRAIGNSIGSGTHWVFAALVAQYFTLALHAFSPGYIFTFFAGMMVLQLVWVLTMVPETKGIPLEELQKKLGVE